MKVPFCLPLIDKDVIDEVNDTLLNTGWLTSGPKVLQLEKEISKLTKVENVVCVNSWTSGAMLVLKWFGIGHGDEVIIPAYTYSATALCAMNLGAKVIMVDVNEDFNINVQNIKQAITVRTKAIIPVDIGGYPADYDEIMLLANSDFAKNYFTPANERQKKLLRPLVISDAAHSIGAEYNGLPMGHSCDFTIFSLHSVKNITAGEGGAVCINLPKSFELKKVHQFLKIFSLNGQTKSAFQKNQAGSWRYDIIAQGLKINMPDVCAAIALAQARIYKTHLLPERKRIVQYYDDGLRDETWTILPKTMDSNKQSSCHLYLLRIRNINEQQRDKIIQLISQNNVGVNVHYIPMPMLSLFKNIGYDMKNYPTTYKLYANVITLPVYNGLTDQHQDRVIEVLKYAYSEVML